MIALCVLIALALCAIKTYNLLKSDDLLISDHPMMKKENTWELWGHDVTGRLVYLQPDTLFFFIISL